MDVRLRLKLCVCVFKLILASLGITIKFQENIVLLLSSELHNFQDVYLQTSKEMAEDYSGEFYLCPFEIDSHVCAPKKTTCCIPALKSEDKLHM